MEKNVKNLEFDNSGKKKPEKVWNLRTFEKNLEKPRMLNENP